MIYKKILFLTFWLIALIGCGNTQTEKSDKNFKNYFFQPEWFKEPKIYEYETLNKANGEKSIVYRYFEKIDNKKLKVIIYDKDFNQSVIIIYEYLPDKVIINNITTVETWNENKLVMEKLTDNVVFDYKKMNKDFGFTHTTRSKNETGITKFVIRSLRKTDTQEFNDEEVNVVIASGRTKIVFDRDNMTINSDEKLVYAENIGVIYQEFIIQNNKGVTNLSKILTKDEFEKMKNAR